MNVKAVVSKHDAPWRSQEISNLKAKDEISSATSVHERVSFAPLFGDLLFAATRLLPISAVIVTFLTSFMRLQHTTTTKKRSRVTTFQ